MYHLNCFTAALCLFAVASACEQTPTGSGQDSLSVQNPDGLRLLVAAENAHPMLRIVLPGYATSDKSIEVLFPEHVTAIKHGSPASEQLYRFRRGLQGEPPTWRRAGRSLEYRMQTLR